MSEQPQGWMPEGTSVLMSLDDETGDRAYFHCTNERNAKLAADTHNAELAAARETYEPLERCEVCNSELSQCGVQGLDGEPSLDCLVCKLREELAVEQYYGKAALLATWEALPSGRRRRH